MVSVLMCADDLWGYQRHQTGCRKERAPYHTVNADVHRCAVPQCNEEKGNLPGFYREWGWEELAIVDQYTHLSNDILIKCS